MVGYGLGLSEKHRNLPFIGVLDEPRIGPVVVVFLDPHATICGAQLSRFFKSAAFPILLVILLAFFVQNLFYRFARERAV